LTNSKSPPIPVIKRLPSQRAGVPLYQTDRKKKKRGHPNKQVSTFGEESVSWTRAKVVILRTTKKGKGGKIENRKEPKKGIPERASQAERRTKTLPSRGFC